MLRYIELELNPSYATYSGSYYFYVFNLALVSDSLFWDNIIDSSSITVMDANTGLTLSKYVYCLNIPLRKGILCWDGPMSSIAKFWVMFDKSYSYLNSTNAFTNSSIGHYIPMCEPSSSMYDLVTGGLYTASATALYSSSGRLGDAVDFSSASAAVTGSSYAFGTGSLTIFMVAYLRSQYHTSYSLLLFGGPPQLNVASSNRYYWYHGTNQVPTLNNALTYNQWETYTITRRSDATTSTYVNGVLSGAADRDGGAISGDSSNLVIGNWSAKTNAIDGLMQHVVIANGVKSDSWVLTTSNMFYSNLYFYGFTGGYGGSFPSVTEISGQETLTTTVGCFLGSGNSYAGPARVDGFDGIAISFPSFNFLFGITTDFEVQMSDSYSGTFRTILSFVDNGIYSSFVEHSYSNSSGSLVLYLDRVRCKYIKIVFTNSAVTDYYIPIHNIKKYKNHREGAK